MSILGLRPERIYHALDAFNDLCADIKAIRELLTRIAADLPTVRSLT
jgi:hypothetical protein